MGPLRSALSFADLALKILVLLAMLVCTPMDSRAQTFGVLNPIPGRPNEVARIAGVTVKELPNPRGQPRALYFVSGMAIDADGAVHAYHPMDEVIRKPLKPTIALDRRQLAGKPYIFPWGLDSPEHGAGGGALKDPKTKERVIQNQPGVPGYGYYISPTSLVDKNYPERDPRRYVDSLKTPYVALPPSLRARYKDKNGFWQGIHGGARVGDICLVVNHRTGLSAFAVFADVGPETTIGEGSLELAKRLGVENANPINGSAPAGTITYVVFPGSGRGQGYIPSNREIIEQGNYLVRGWRGMEELSSSIVRDNYPAPYEGIPSVPPTPPPKPSPKPTPKPPAQPFEPTPEGPPCSGYAAQYTAECDRILKQCIATNCKVVYSDCRNQCGSCAGQLIPQTFSNYWCQTYPSYLPTAKAALDAYVGEVRRCVSMFLAGQLKWPYMRDQQIGYCTAPHAKSYEDRWKKAIADACMARCTRDGRRGALEGMPVKCMCR